MWRKRITERKRNTPNKASSSILGLRRRLTNSLPSTRESFLSHPTRDLANLHDGGLVVDIRRNQRGVLTNFLCAWTPQAWEGMRREQDDIMKGSMAVAQQGPVINALSEDPKRFAISERLHLRHANEGLEICNLVAACKADANSSYIPKFRFKSATFEVTS